MPMALINIQNFKLWAIAYFITFLMLPFSYATSAEEKYDSAPKAGNKQIEGTQKVSRKVKYDDESYLWVFPPGDLYPRYIADPRTPQTGFMPVWLKDSEIPDGGDSRFHLAAGGRFGLLRFFRHDNPDYGVEVNIEAGFLAQFNRDKSMDNNGWDGLYSLMIAWRPFDKWAFKLAAQHDSSHIGDEYIENTNAKRITYTREELAAGTSCKITPWLNAYAEVGNAYRKMSDEQENIRVQAGMELTGALNMLDNSSGLYAAIDMVSWEENDWNLSLTIQTGIRTIITESKQQYRIALQYYNGRSHIGEFYQYDESYLSIGVWIDI